MKKWTLLLALLIAVASAALWAFKVNPSSDKGAPKQSLWGKGSSDEVAKSMLETARRLLPDSPTEGVIETRYMDRAPTIQQSLSGDTIEAVFDQLLDRCTLDKRTSSLRLEINLAGLPNAELATILTTVSQVVDTNGKDILDRKDYPKGISLNWKPAFDPYTISPPFDLDKSASKIDYTKLTGELTVYWPKTVERLTFESARSGASQRLGNIYVTLEKVERDIVHTSTSGVAPPALVYPLAFDAQGRLLAIRSYNYPKGDDATQAGSRFNCKVSGEIAKVELLVATEVETRTIPLEMETPSYRADGTPNPLSTPRYLSTRLSALAEELDRAAVEKQIGAEFIAPTGPSSDVKLNLSLPHHLHSNSIILDFDELESVFEYAGAFVLLRHSDARGFYDEYPMSERTIYLHDMQFSSQEPTTNDVGIDGSLQIHFPLQFSVEKASVSEPDTEHYSVKFEQNNIEIYRKVGPSGVGSMDEGVQTRSRFEAFDESGQRLATLERKIPAFPEEQLVARESFTAVVSSVLIYHPAVVEVFRVPYKLKKLN